MKLASELSGECITTASDRNQLNMSLKNIGSLTTFEKLKNESQVSNNLKIESDCGKIISQVNSGDFKSGSTKIKSHNNFETNTSVNFYKHDKNQTHLKNIKSRIISKETGFFEMSEMGLQNRIQVLEELLKSREDENEKLKSEVSVLQLQVENTQIIVERNAELSEQIKNLETSQNYSACNSSDCKETINALNKQLTEHLGELMKLKRAKSTTSQTSMLKLPNENERNTENEENEETEEDMEIEKILRESFMQEILLSADRSTYRTSLQNYIN